MDVSEDQFLGGAVHVFQPVRGYRAATDPVFLASSIPAKNDQHVLDVGTGVGTAALCLAARIKNIQITGIDFQEDLVELAHRNGEHNQYQDQLSFHCANILDRPLKELSNSFDHVMANPPFYEAGSGQRPPNEIKAKANMESEATLSDWINFMFKMAKPRATLTMINRTERLDETLSVFQGKVGEIIIYPLWSTDPTGSNRKGAKRFLIQGRKTIKAPLMLSPGLVIHNEEGGYQQKAKEILMSPSFLDLKK